MIIDSNRLKTKKEEDFKPERKRIFSQRGNLGKNSFQYVGIFPLNIEFLLGNVWILNLIISQQGTISNIKS